MKFLIGLGVIAIVIFVLWDKLAPVWKILYGWVRFALEKILEHLSSDLTQV